MSKKWILVLQVPLIPEVSFPNSSTHVLPGNYHLSRGEGRNVGVISSGLPRGRWTRYKEKVCISWFGGVSLDLVQSWGNAIFQTGPWTQSSVSSPGLWPHVTASGAPSTTGSPLAVTWGQVVDAVCQADGSWRVKRDSCDLSHC